MANPMLDYGGAGMGGGLGNGSSPASTAFDFADSIGSSNVTDIPLESLGNALVPAVATPPREYPPAILKLSSERLEEISSWLAQWILDLTAMQQPKQDEWSEIEDAYRARSEAPKKIPFVGACTDVVPAIAMAVEPVHARIDTGVFKQDPVFRGKPVRKSIKRYSKAIEDWVNFYMRHIVDLRQVSSPRMLELCKLGTAVFKVPYVLERCSYYVYDDANKPKKLTGEISFAGPKPKGIELGDLLFHPGYQNLQDCPLVAERQRTTLQDLRTLETQGYLANVDKVARVGNWNRTTIEETREAIANHQSQPSRQEDIVVFECWFRRDIDGDGYAESYVATFEPNTHALVQLRYNPYFHQRYPYVVIPCMVTNQSLYGIGFGEMSLPMQRSITGYHQMAMDNARIANSRMYIVKRGTPGLEDGITVYAGKTIYADDVKDVVPFAHGDIYPSTLTERQNLFGMLEKRTGVSDYLTGRESPVIGSRATATSTLALIQEGTKRVEHLMENIRRGYNEMMELCMMVWAQYGVGDIDDYVFGSDDTAALVDEFFKNVVDASNVKSLLVLDVGVTDATTNRQVQQQMQLSLIQMMTSYFGQLIQVSQTALAAQATMPGLTELIKAVVASAETMYKDLLDKYDIPNADAYLPDVLPFLAIPAVQPPAAPGQGPSFGPSGGPGPAGVPQSALGPPNVPQLSARRGPP